MPKLIVHGAPDAPPPPAVEPPAVEAAPALSVEDAEREVQAWAERAAGLRDRLERIARDLATVSADLTTSRRAAILGEDRSADIRRLVERERMLTEEQAELAQQVTIAEAEEFTAVRARDAAAARAAVAGIEERWQALEARTAEVEQAIGAAYSALIDRLAERFELWREATQIAEEAQVWNRSARPGMPTVRRLHAPQFDWSAVPGADKPLAYRLPGSW